jgi:hypothetical protein
MKLFVSATMSVAKERCNPLDVGERSGHSLLRNSRVAKKLPNAGPPAGERRSSAAQTADIYFSLFHDRPDLSPYRMFDLS